MSDPVIEISDLNYSYSPERKILENVNFKIMRGENCCILGPNGGGKTTLLKLLLGFIKPDSGSIRILGNDIKKVRHKIGYMPQIQKVDCIFPISVLEVVMSGTVSSTAGAFFNSKKRCMAQTMLKKMNVMHLAERDFNEISGGEKQRVLIARSLVTEPEILLLDEPTANIDPGAEQCFYEMLDDLQKNLTLLTVSHDLGFVNRNISKIICVNRFVKIHTPAAFNGRDIDDIYNYHVHMVSHSHDCHCGKHIRRVKK